MVIQEHFRQWFGHWGLPEEIRLDNGSPWGGWYDLLTVFALWLIGLKLKVHFNPPGKPRHNGVIERFNADFHRAQFLTRVAALSRK